MTVQVREKMYSFLIVEKTIPCREQQGCCTAKINKWKCFQNITSPCISHPLAPPPPLPFIHRGAELRPWPMWELFQEDELAWRPGGHYHGDDESNRTPTPVWPPEPPPKTHMGMRVHTNTHTHTQNPFYVIMWLLACDLFLFLFSYVTSVY